MMISKFRIAAPVLLVVAAVAVALPLAMGEKPSPETSLQEKPAEKAASAPALGAKPENGMTFQIIGTVVAADGKTPMKDVEVWVSAGMGTLFRVAETTTDKDGKFELKFGPKFGLPGGKVWEIAVVHVRKPGWYGWYYGWPDQFILSDEPLPEADKKCHSGYTNLVPGKPSQLLFRMERAASLKARVVDGAGKPMANLSIWLTGENCPQRRTYW